MEPSKLLFKKEQRTFCSLETDFERIIFTFSKIQGIRELPSSQVWITTRAGKSLSGRIYCCQPGLLVLSPNDSSQLDQVSFIQFGSIETLGLSWAPNVLRFYVERSLRESFPAVGGLELSRALDKLSSFLPSEIKSELKFSGDWNSSTEEDFLILEDYLTVIIQLLQELKCEFPDEVTKLRTIYFQKPNGSFKIAGQSGALTVQLPYESSSILQDADQMKSALNEVLTQI
jgi:hypothetical protein